MKTYACCYCGGVLFRHDKRVRHHHAKYCWPCFYKRQVYHGRAMGKVAKAIRDGFLPSVLSKLCVDCGAPAHGYDHRDYGKPLQVEPVCRSCNSRHGQAAWPMELAA